MLLMWVYTFLSIHFQLLHSVIKPQLKTNKIKQKAKTFGAGFFHSLRKNSTELPNQNCMNHKYQPITNFISISKYTGHH